jgi:hypothetical protein
MATLTSANSTLAIAILNLYPVAQSVQGYAADDAFSIEAVDQAEVVMGVDGVMSAGFIFNPVKFTVTIQADSPSLKLFDDWQTAQRAAREVYIANAAITLPGIRKKYTLNKGILTTVRAMPDVKKILQPVSFVITFESITGESY